MAIIKLYRREAGGALRYRHYAPKGPRARSFMVLTGKVGSATNSVRPVRVPDREEYLRQVVSDGADEGFMPFLEDAMAWVVQQFRLRTDDLSHPDDRWLFDNAEGHVGQRLLMRGVGHVDGNDIGGRVFNVFSKVVDGDAAVESLRTLDRIDKRFAQQTVAVRTPDMPAYEVRFPTAGNPDFEPC